jgi:hypothetical protein
MCDTLGVYNVKGGNIENRNALKPGTRERNSDACGDERNIDGTIVKPVPTNQNKYNNWRRGRSVGKLAILRMTNRRLAHVQRGG